MLCEERDGLWWCLNHVLLPHSTTRSDAAALLQPRTNLTQNAQTLASRRPTAIARSRLR